MSFTKGTFYHSLASYLKLITIVLVVLEERYGRFNDHSIGYFREDIIKMKNTMEMDGFQKEGEIR